MRKQIRQKEKLEAIESEMEQIKADVGDLRGSLGRMHERITRAKEAQTQVEKTQEALKGDMRQLMATLVQKEEALQKIDTLMEMEERRLGARQLLTTPATAATIAALVAGLIVSL